MKTILTILFFISLNAQATDYWVTPNGAGSGTGLSEANAMSYVTLNSTALVAGDIVQLKRGEIFYGSLVTDAGTIESRVTYTTYSTGANPIISGMTELTSWTLSSGNIYYATLDVTWCNIITLDGALKARGRYPNTGYLNYESNSGNTSITDNELTGSPSWVGAEVVIRKYRWITDRHTVTAHSTTTLTYSALGDYGNNTFYSPVAGNGYFIQSHLSTLDVEGEWYYDNAANRLYMHFGAGTPSGRVVKAATIDNSITAAAATTFNDIDFVGSNLYGINMTDKTYFIFNDCNFSLIGAYGVYGGATNNVEINGGSITDVLDNGIWMEYQTSLITIDGVTLTNIGVIPGAGLSGDGHGNAILVSTNGVTSTNIIVKNCAITNVGYIGIGLVGDNVLVEKNKIDNFCTVKDDGAGIYTVISGTYAAAANRIIRNNIVLNAIGAYLGAEAFSYEAFGKAAGIYLDDYTNNVEVTGNIVAHGEWGGIFINGQSPNTITGNLVYDFAYCLLINNYSVARIRNLIVTGNTFIAKTATQKVLHIYLGSVNDDISLFGTFNNNYYARPIDDNLSISVDRAYSGGGGVTDYSLATWQSTFAHDAASSKSLVTISDVDDFRFDYNFSASSADVTLSGTWKDIINSLYTDPLSLAAYGGKVLMAYSAPASANKIYITSGGKVWKLPTGEILMKPE